jgi:hypothetical protein
MNQIWLIKLILSHLLTDFVLQPKKWVDARVQKHFASSSLYIHGLITAIVALLFIGISYWFIAVIILVTHILIDGWKSYRPQNLTYFLIDQFLHVLIIIGCWYFVFSEIEDPWNILEHIGHNEEFWTIATAYIFLTFPAGIMIGQMTKKWSDKLPDAGGLANAGKWIGIVERLSILTFLLQDQYAALGLLMTAKGLLRFSEKDRQEEKTEYVLIGTLISVFFALMTGILVLHLIKD